MQQILSVWNAFDARRRVVVLFSVTSVFAAILYMAHLVATPAQLLLYSGLDPAVSGQVVTALEQSGVAYSVKGTSIYVDASKRDSMRMTLAEQGLPPSGAAGYELLDGLSGFGTTAQMFDVAYWRAKEGELARTILVWPQVQSVRVHIANPSSRPFAQAKRPVASVTVKLSGGALAPSQVRALRFLVASAVSGLSPKDVSVIDADQGLITVDNDQSGLGYSNTRATALKSNIERLLSARVGAGNAVVEVSVDTSRQKEKLVQHSFDPKSRVAISTDTEEVNGSSSGSDASGVTVASNLPSGNKSGAGSSSNSSNSNTRERVNYEVSETTRELVTQPGKIIRLSVAVLVNGTIDKASGTWSSRTPEELASLEELVKSTVGFDAKRGDVVTIKSMEFPPIPSVGTAAKPSIFAAVSVNAPVIIQSALLAIVVLALGLFVVRPALNAAPPPLLAAPVEANLLDGPEIGLGDGQLAIAPLDSFAEQPADPVAHLREVISERQDDAIEVLRNWVESSEEQA